MTVRTKCLQAGFTLLEAIVTISIFGIVAAMVAMFIRIPVENYVGSVRRAEMTDAAESALRRLARDVRLAVPNSLRVDCTTVANVCHIEFVMSSTGGRYRDSGDGSAGGNELSFTSALSTTFDVIGQPGATAVSPGDFVVVYNETPATVYGGATRALVSLVAGNTVTLATNPFAGRGEAARSPDSRFQVVPGGTRAVSYRCPTVAAGAGAMTRFWNYGFNAAQTTAFGAAPSATVLTSATCEVDYVDNVSQRNGLLYVRLDVQDVPSGESVSMFQQIHVDNSP